MSFVVKNILIFKNLKKYKSKIDKTLPDHRIIFFIIYDMWSVFLIAKKRPLFCRVGGHGGVKNFKILDKYVS